MSALRRLAKRAVVHTVARVAPITWRWRRPGSLVVLMYHRVLPKDSPARQTEQPGMYVSPETLDMHLSELKRHFELVHLDDWLRAAKAGKPLPRLACALTFDDGWRDNYDFALPVLVKHQAPATIFLVSSYIGTMERFWPNRLMNLLAKSFAEPQAVAFPEALGSIVEPVLAHARRRGRLSVEDVDRAVEDAKQLNEATIRDLIARAEESCAECGDVRDVLSCSEVVQMAATGLVRFGSHTTTHFRLGGEASRADLEREIVFSKEQIGGICGQNIELFCYPNGEISVQSVNLVRTHYLGAVTTRAGWHSPSGDPHLIRRVALHEDISNSAECFRSRVSNWL